MVINLYQTQLALRHLISFFLLIVCTLYAQSQDKIITIVGDTIQCQITRISDDFIHYTIGDPPTRSRISRGEVVMYEWLSSIRKEDPLPEPSDSIPPELEEYPETRLAINVGYTYQFEGYETFPEDYQDKVRSLWNIGIEGQFFTTRNFGIGVKYNRIRTQVTHLFEQNGTFIDEDIRFHFLAISVLGRQAAITDRDFVLYGLSGGIVSYRDDGTINGDLFFEEGLTLGASLDLGYDYYLKSGLGFGVALAINIARLNNINVNGNNISGANFGLSRFDLTLGIRYAK